MTQKQISKLRGLINALLGSNFAVIKPPFAPNTACKFSVTRIYPHRHVSNTDCYGTYFPDYWIKDLVYEMYENKYNLPRWLVARFFYFLDIAQEANPPRFGSIVDERECDGFGS